MMTKGLDRIELAVMCAKCKSFLANIDYTYEPDVNSYKLTFKCHGAVEKIMVPRVAIDDFCAAFTQKTPLKAFVGERGEAAFGNGLPTGLAGLIEANKGNKLVRRRPAAMGGRGVSGDDRLSGSEESLAFPVPEGFSALAADTSKEKKKKPGKLQAATDRAKLLRQAISNFGMTIEEATAAMAAFGVAIDPIKNPAGSASSNSSSSSVLPKVKKPKAKKKKVGKRSLDL